MVKKQSYANVIIKSYIQSNVIIKMKKNYSYHIIRLKNVSIFSRMKNISLKPPIGLHMKNIILILECGEGHHCYK